MVGTLATAGWYVCVCVFIWGGSGDFGAGGGGGGELWVSSNIMNLVVFFLYNAASHTAHVHYFSRVYTLSVVIYVLLSWTRYHKLLKVH